MPAPASIQAAYELNKTDYRSASADLTFKIYKTNNKSLTYQEISEICNDIKSTLEANLPEEIINALTLHLTEPTSPTSPTRTFSIYLYAPNLHPIDTEDYLNEIVFQISNLTTPEDIKVFQQSEKCEDLLIVKFRPSIELPIRSTKTYATEYLQKFGNIIYTEELELNSPKNKLSLQFGSLYEGPSIYYILELKTDFLPKTKVNFTINEQKKGQLYFNILSKYRHCQYCRSTTHRIQQCPVFIKCQACKSDHHSFVMCDKVDESKRIQSFETLSKCSQKTFFSYHTKYLPSWMERFRKETENIKLVSDDINLNTYYPSPDPSDIEEDMGSPISRPATGLETYSSEIPTHLAPPPTLPHHTTENVDHPHTLPTTEAIMENLEEIESSILDVSQSEHDTLMEESIPMTPDENSSEIPAALTTKSPKTPKKIIPKTSRVLRSQSLKSKNLINALETAHATHKPVKEVLSNLTRKIQGDTITHLNTENANVLNQAEGETLHSSTTSNN
ncbi:hypothetical protein DAMA08_017760 [Martiniozyma asiatica (nom. inval.)]|nr:hypothetical protein DAMA08_017760 [Martiniozyma asiatica]